MFLVASRALDPERLCGFAKQFRRYMSIFLLGTQNISASSVAAERQTVLESYPGLEGERGSGLHAALAWPCLGLRPKPYIADHCFVGGWRALGYNMSP